MKQKKIQSIVAIRGVAVILVMLCHFFSETALNIKSHDLNFVTNLLGHIGVALFFIVSGFVLPYSMFKYDYTWSRFGRYISRRAVRIEPPYLMSIILVLLCMLVKLMIGQTVNYPLGIWPILAHLLYLNDLLGLPWLNVVYWTLAIEFQFYLFIGLIFPLFKGQSGGYLVVMLIVLCFFKILTAENYWLIRHLPFFVTGYAICSYVLKKLNLSQLILVITACGLINLTADDFVYSIMNVVVILLFVVIFFLKNARFPRWLLFVGEISYSLYLLHNILVAGLCILNPLGLSLELRIILSMVFLVLGIYPCYLFYRIIERPFHLMAQNIER